MSAREFKRARVVEEAVLRNDGCEVAGLFHLLAGRWILPTLWELHRQDGSIRFSELKKNLKEVTNSELSRALRLLESAHLIDKKIYAEKPPRVEYFCTDLGRSIRAPIDELAKWQAEHLDKILGR